MSGHRLGYDMGMALAAGLLDDPGDAGTVVINAGSGFSVLVIPGGSATDAIVLPASPAGTVLLVVNDSGGTLAITESGTAGLDSDLADGGVELCVASTDTWTSLELVVAS